MFDDKYKEITEFMDKCLYQEAAFTMEEAIQQYLVNGPDVVDKLISELDEVLASDLDESELLDYVERHSDYVENDSARDTFKLIRQVLVEGVQT